MATNPSQHGAGEWARDDFQRLFTDRDFDAVKRYWSDRTAVHFLALGETVQGPAQLEAFFRELFAAVPDAHMQVEDIVESGLMAVVQWTLTGTMTGTAFRGFESTGRPLHLRGVDVMRFSEDAHIEENTVYYDGAEFARQLGMLPRQKSPADRAIIGAFNTVVRLRRRVKRTRPRA